MKRKKMHLCLKMLRSAREEVETNEARRQLQTEAKESGVKLNKEVKKKQRKLKKQAISQHKSLKLKEYEELSTAIFQKDFTA